MFKRIISTACVVFTASSEKDVSAVQFLAQRKHAEANLKTKEKMDPEEMKEFVKEHLVPEFNKIGFETLAAKNPILKTGNAIDSSEKNNALLSFYSIAKVEALLGAAATNGDVVETELFNYLYGQKIMDEFKKTFGGMTISAMKKKIAKQMVMAIGHGNKMVEELEKEEEEDTSSWSCGCCATKSEKSDKPELNEVIVTRNTDCEDDHTSSADDSVALCERDADFFFYELVGRTLTELLFSAKLTNTDEEKQKYANKYSGIASKPKLNGDFRESNGMFIGHNFRDSVSKEYQALAESNFDAKVSPLNEDYSLAVKQVNDYVSESTNGMIKKILNDGEIDEDTIMALVNAVTLSVNWKTPFIEDHIGDFRGAFFELATGAEGKFHQSNSKDVRMMKAFGQKEGFRYGETMIGSSKFQALTIETYTDLEVSFIKPVYKKEGNVLEFKYPTDNINMGTYAKDLKLLADNMSSQRGSEIVKQLLDVNLLENDEHYKKEVDISIPSFELEDETDLKSFYEGSTPNENRDSPKTMFLESSENGQYFDKALANGKSMVGLMRHKASIKVADFGAEFSAATVAIVSKCASCAPGKKQKEPRQFHANTPFVMVIRERNSGLIVGQGFVAHLEKYNFDK